MYQLITHDSRRFSQLKPAGTESNKFMYHLNTLLEDGAVEKRPDGRYQLTGSGKAYADQLSLKTMQPRLQPRIVTLLAIRNSRGEWLLSRRKRQPMMGLTGFPYGKLHQGESVHLAAERELAEKTGLKADLLHRGDGYITIRESGETVSQVLFHLFYAESYAGQLIESLPVVKNYWATLESIAPNELIPSMPDLVQLINEHPSGRFFCELEYEI